MFDPQCLDTPHDQALTDRQAFLKQSRLALTPADQTIARRPETTHVEQRLQILR